MRVTAKIKVYVIDFGDKGLRLRWRNPITRKFESVKAGTDNLRDATKAAGRKEAELTGAYAACDGAMPWLAFREKYRTEFLDFASPGTKKHYTVALDACNATLKHLRLSEITAATISHLRASLRKPGRSEATIAGYLRDLRAALSWAMESGLVTSVPAFPRSGSKRTRNVSRGGRSKGRPVTRPEFDQMLAAIPAVVGEEPDQVESWRRTMIGLYLSGLRLEESQILHWNRSDLISVDMNGPHPMLRIPGEHEKGAKDRVLPMAPEFAELLLGTPETDRRGFVFNPLSRRASDRHRRISAATVGRTISLIGQAAGIKVREGKGAEKFASSHDLRRSFGLRWAHRVQPATLMILMRHESITTTMTYYATEDAAEATAAIHEAFGKLQGKPDGFSTPKPASIKST